MIPRPTAATRSARPRIVFVNRYFHPDQSATSQLLSDLCFGLAVNGWDVHVVCSRQLYEDARAELAAEELVDGVCVHRVASTRFGRRRLAGRAIDYATFYVSAAWHLWRALGRGDVLVAKTDPPLISVIAAVAARRRGAVLVNWLQDVFPEVATRLGLNPLPSFLDRGLRRLRDAGLMQARMNVVLGERMRETILRAGVPAERIDIIENWAVDAGQPPAAPIESGASGLRARLGLADRFVIAYSGNLGRAHDHGTLLEAARLLQGAPRMVFLMIGGGAGMEALRQAVVQSALQNFIFLPHQPRSALGDSLAAADVHWVSLLPELEGLVVPSKAYGILAAGRPLMFVGDRDGEIARLVTTYDCGASVEVGDGAALAAQFSALEADPVRRLRMGGNGHRLYRDRFTLQAALARWSAILCSLTSAGAGAALAVKASAAAGTDRRLPHNAR